MSGSLDWVIGKTVEEVVAALGKRRVTAVAYVGSRGYRLGGDGRYEAAPNALEVEAAIASRIAATPPTTPCFRCGCRVCACTDRLAS